MKSEDYWVIFSKTGSVEDYHRYRVILEAEQKEKEDYDSQHKGTDNKGTKYR